MLAPQMMGPPYLAPPEVPLDRAAALRVAFDETMTDPAFLAEAHKLGIDISPLSRQCDPRPDQKSLRYVTIGCCDGA